MAPRIPSAATNYNSDVTDEQRDKAADNCTLVQSNPTGHLSEPTNPSTSNSVESISPTARSGEGGMIGEG